MAHLVRCYCRPLALGSKSCSNFNKNNETFTDTLPLLALMHQLNLKHGTLPAPLNPTIPKYLLYQQWLITSSRLTNSFKIIVLL